MCSVPKRDFGNLKSTWWISCSWSWCLRNPSQDCSRVSFLSGKRSSKWRLLQASEKLWGCLWCGRCYRTSATICNDFWCRQAADALFTRPANATRVSALCTCSVRITRHQLVHSFHAAQRSSAALCRILCVRATASNSWILCILMNKAHIQENPSEW